MTRQKNNNVLPITHSKCSSVVNGLIYYSHLGAPIDGMIKYRQYGIKLKIFLNIFKSVLVSPSCCITTFNITLITTLHKLVKGRLVNVGKDLMSSNKLGLPAAS